MGSNGPFSKELEGSKVEFISLTNIFEELCPIYMAYGMSYDEYWHGEAYATKFYRKKHELQVKQKDEESWIQGMYIYEALCYVAPVLHAFSKSGTKPLPYRDKPYLFDMKKEVTEEEKQQEIDNERLKAQIHFKNWAEAVAKKFENKKDGGVS